MKINIKGIWIPFEILANKDLSDKEKLIYSIILYFSKEKSYCSISNNQLAELLNLTLLQLEKLSISEEEININDSLEAILSPINYSLQYLWINTMLGALLGVIMAAFTKKEKSIFED